MTRKVFLIFAFIFFLNINKISAQTSCPFGLTNDPYPGECARYIDTNQNSICDKSEIEIIKTVSTTKTINKYYFFEISVIFSFLYFFSTYLNKIKKISVLLNRKIWNILLFFSFIGCGISGLISVVKISYSIDIPFYPQLIFIHVETGIIMSVISIFHILWHGNYIKTYFGPK